MIKISVMRQDDDKIIGLSVEGHAGAGAYGQDIVCAAVSALAQSVILGLAQHLHRDVDYDVKPGITCSIKGGPDELEAEHAALDLCPGAVEALKWGISR